MIEEEATIIDLHFKSCTPNFIDDPDPILIHNAVFTVVLKENQTKQITQYAEINHKEIIQGEIWVPGIKLRGQYIFSKLQKLIITLKQDGIELMGQTTLGIILGSPKRIKKVALFDANGNIRSAILVKGWEFHKYEELSLVMDWKAIDLANFSSSFLKKSSSYLKFFMINDNNTSVEVAKTEVIENSETPDWRKISIPLKQLVDCKKMMPYFQVQCLHYDKEKDQEVVIGQAKVQMSRLKYGAFDEKEVFKIKQENSKKTLGSLVMTQRYLQCPQTFLHNMKLMKFGLFIGLNLKKQSWIQQYLPIIDQLIDKIWSIIQPFTCEPKKFIGLNIDSSLNEFDQTDRDEYFDSRMSQHHPEEQFEKDGVQNNSGTGSTSPNSQSKITEGIKKQFLFEEQFNFSEPKDFIADVRNYLKFKQFSAVKKQSNLLPFLDQVRETNDNSNFIVYKIVLIITDSGFKDIEESITSMIEQSIPTSFFILQIGDQDLSETFSLFNEKSLTSLDGMYESDRILSKFMHFNPKKQSAEKFVENFLEPVPFHLMDYIDMFKRKSSCMSEEAIISIRKSST